MKRLLATTALATALALPLSAQINIAVPDGFEPYADVARLTFDRLDGATVFDVDGQSLGEISDIVFAAEPLTEPGSESQAATDPDSAASDPATMPAAEPLADPADTTTADPAADDVADIAEQAADDITDTATTAVEDINDAVEDATGDLAATDTDTTMPDANGADPDNTAAADMGQELTTGDGRVSHVIIDIGGFLGMGVHTVAIPIEALQIYADANETLQIYLPWTEDQLRALPEYEEGNPETLGRMSSE